MKVAIVGAGAMGSLFGALLADAGYDVWLLSTWRDHVTTISNKGLKITYKDHTRTIHLKTATRPEEIGLADVTLVFVKSYHTEIVAGTAAALAGAKGVVVTLQNGLGNAEKLSACIDSNRIIAGTTSHGANILGPGHIHHAGVGATVIGNWDSDNTYMVEEISVAFCQAGIETQAVMNVRPVIWEKLLINVGINAITALTGIRNGQLLDMTITRELSRKAVEEAMKIARAKGINLRTDMVEHVFKVAKATAANRSSMGQDVDHGRMTEISAINGAIVSVGERLSLPTPINETLVALVETLQGHYT
jgi:2-dehydropantoate 2-reductase